MSLLEDTTPRGGTQTESEGTVGVMPLQGQSCGPNSHGDLRPVRRKDQNYRCFGRLKGHAGNLCRVQRPVLGAENQLGSPPEARISGY